MSFKDIDFDDYDIDECYFKTERFIYTRLDVNKEHGFLIEGHIFKQYMSLIEKLDTDEHIPFMSVIPDETCIIFENTCEYEVRFNIFYIEKLLVAELGEQYNDKTFFCKNYEFIVLNTEAIREEVMRKMLEMPKVWEKENNKILDKKYDLYANKCVMQNMRRRRYGL